MTIEKLNNISFNGKSYNIINIIINFTNTEGDKLFKWLNQQTPAKNLRNAIKKLEITKITAHSF
jgi:hypothetical protein